LLEACRRLTIAGTCAKVRGASSQHRWLLSFIGVEPDLFVDRPATTTGSVPPRTVPPDRAQSLPAWTRREHPAVSRHRLPGTTSPPLD